MPARTLLSSEQRTRLFAIPTDPAEMARHYVLERRRSGARTGQAACEQPAGLRRSALRASPSGPACWTVEQPPAAMIAFVAQQLGGRPALFADYAQRDQTRREHAVELQRYLGLRQLRVGGLARLPSGGRRRGLGHGSRRTHRPGDARPSADERRLASGGGGVGANRAGRASPGAKENLRGHRGRAVRHRSGTRSTGLLAVDPELRRSRFAWLRDYSESPAPSNIVALLDRLEYVRGLGIDAARAGRIHAARLARLVDEGAIMTVQHIADLEPARRTAILVVQAAEPGNPARRRDARHVREIHGHLVQPGAEPRRAAFPGHAARCRQGTDPVPPHHRRAPPREGSRRGRRRRGRTRDRHEAARWRASRHRGRGRRGGSGHPRHGGRAILGAAPVQPALPRGVRLPVEHAATIRCSPPSSFSGRWIATAPAPCPNVRRRRSCRRNGAS